MRELSSKYIEKFDKDPIFENAFYLTFVLKPKANDVLEECIRELEDIQIRVMRSLKPYEPELLSMYEYNGNCFSRFYEFFAYLYNGFWERVPVTSLPLFQVIETSILYHGYKLIETRFPNGGNRYAAYFDLKDFPEVTTRNKFNPLLEMHFPFLLCLSFTFIDSSDSIRMINQALNKMLSAGDEADEQQEEMERGKGSIMSGQVCFGELHGALAVFGKNEKQAEDFGSIACSSLSGQCATLFVPATISAPETFFSMVPGNVKRRPRPMPKTTRNLLGLFSMNNYSSGRQFGNALGDGSALLPLQTSANGVYHLNLHYAPPGLKLAAHTLLLGTSGVGKTATQTFFLSFLERFDYKLFAIDKDCSMRGFVESQGGTYFRLANGVPTGLNPFQLPLTEQNQNFLYDLVLACSGRQASDEAVLDDSKYIKEAVDNVLKLDFEHRRFGMLLQNIPDLGENCLARRLAVWCHAPTDGGYSDGRYAYALDNPSNSFEWESFKRVGFDVSDFLVEGHPATEPILSYLFHLKKLMQRNGGLLATVVEEFWLPLQYPTTAKQIMDILKTGRRRDEFIVLVSQSPEDVTRSKLLPDILQETRTKIFLANPGAEFNPPEGGGYHRFLSQKEFQKLKKFDLQSRLMLIKQGAQSAVVKLDLEGMGDDIAVFAMAAEDFEIFEAAKSQAGNHPDQWVPLYKSLRREVRQQAHKI